MSLRKQATAGLIWTFSQQFGNQIIGFAISLILARILMPEEFGLIGMIAVFVSVGRSLIDSGLTLSLVRSEKPNQADFSTVFYFNLAAGVIIYGLVYIVAPFLSNFYDRNILTPILRLYCITFIIGAFSAVQRTRLTKKLDFKTQTLITIPSNILGGVTGISMAYMGYGVWSLVWSQIVSSLVSSAQFWWYSKWVPSFVFSKQKFKEHFNFGYKLMLSGLIDKVFSNLYLIVIGKYFSAGQVGFYTRAETMKQLPVANISSALNQVTYPLFSSIQDDDSRLKNVYKQLMQMVVFIIAPILVFLAVLAEPTFRFLFTEKWLPAVPYFQILCFTGILHPVHSYNLNVLKVKGRSDLFLRLEVIKKVILVVAIIGTIGFGIRALLYGQVAVSVLAFIINTHYTGKYINYKILEQSLDIFPILMFSAISGLFIYIAEHFFMQEFADFIRLLIGGLLGTTIYMILSLLFQKNVINNLLKIVSKK